MKYRAIVPVTLHQGAVLIGMTPEQLRRRRHLVREVEGGHEVVTPTQFKVGEEFETDLALSKGLVLRLDAPAEAAAETAAAPAEAPAPDAGEAATEPPAKQRGKR